MFTGIRPRPCSNDGGSTVRFVQARDREADEMILVFDNFPVFEDFIALNSISASIKRTKFEGPGVSRDIARMERWRVLADRLNRSTDFRKFQVEVEDRA